MKRGHIRVKAVLGVERRKKVLRDAGVKTLYQNNLTAALKSVRRGEQLYCVGLRGLASSREGTPPQALGRSPCRNACAIDVRTGWRSDGPKGAALMAEAARELGVERLGGDAALKSTHGKAGGHQGRGEPPG